MLASPWEHLIEPWSALSFLAGSVLALRALLSLLRHLQSPHETPLAIPLALSVGAAMCLWIPSVVGVHAPTASVEGALAADAPQERPLAEAGLANKNPEQTQTSTSPRSGLSAESFASAQKTAALELEAKGLGLARPAVSEDDGGALAWLVGALAALAAMAGVWARRAAKRIGREKEAQALPSVDLNAKLGSGER